jgi:hypothetical protein
MQAPALIGCHDIPSSRNLDYLVDYVWVTWDAQ